MAKLCLTFGLLSFCLPVVCSIPAIVLGIWGQSRIRRSDGRLTGDLMATLGIYLGVFSTVLGLVFPLVLYQFNDTLDRKNRIRASQVNNLTRIAQALGQYESTHGTLPPPVTCDEQGRPLLSWRVLILPFLGEEPLYRRFRLDQPWDSPANKPLRRQMPGAYLAADEWVFAATRYKLIVTRGKQRPASMFVDGEGSRLAEITDGPENTIMVVELGEPVPWTMPEYVEFFPDGPASLSVRPVGRGDGFFPAVMGDGTLRRIPDGLDRVLLRALITRDGGEPVEARRVAP